MAREPEALLGPSFQMSFAAVAALIAGNEIWRRYRPEPEPEEQGRRFRQPDLVARIGRTVLLALGGIIATTILASLATAPFSAFHFHRLNPYGLIGNTLAIPLVSLVVMPAAVIGTLLLPLGLDGLVWSLMGEGIRGVLHVANAVASIEGAAPAIPRAPPMLFGLLVVALLTLLLFRSHLRLLSLPLLLVWAVLLRALPPPDLMIAPDGRMALIRTDQPGAFRLLSPATPSGFTLAQWLPALGDQRGPRDPSLRTGIRCDRNGCTGRLADGRPVAVALTLEAIRQDCTRAHLIVTPLSIPAGLCPSATLVIGRDQLARYGAIRLTLANDGTIRTLESSLHPESPRPWRKSLQEPTAMAANPPTSREAIPQPSVAERSDDDPALEPAPAQPLSTVE